VIHAAHSIYIHEMGALRKFLPYTWLFMGLATLSLIGLPPFPGFWSKEAVLTSALNSEHYLLFAIGLISVVFTAFYSMRYFGMMFHGQTSEHIQKQLHTSHHHVHEGYVSQTIACGALAVGIVLFGLFGLKAEHVLHHLFETELVHNLSLATVHLKPLLSKGVMVSLSIGSILLGAVPAYLFYYTQKWNPQAVYDSSNAMRMLHAFLWNRWYINAFYNWFFVRGVMRLARGVADLIEVGVDTLIHRILPSTIFACSKISMTVDREGIDGILDGSAYHVQNSAGGGLSKIQTGRIQEYLAMAVFVAMIIFGAIWFF
jgi:NADH-quinone oxidoreductase subunit L